MGSGFFNRLKFGGNTGEAAIHGQDFTASIPEKKEKKEQGLKIESGSNIAKAEDSTNKESGDQVLKMELFNKEGHVFGVFDTVNEKNVGPKAAKVAKNFFEQNFDSVFTKKKDAQSNLQLPNFKNKLNSFFRSAAAHMSQSGLREYEETTATVMGLLKTEDEKTMQAVVGHVGDSAVFLLSKGALSRITIETHKTVSEVRKGFFRTTFNRILSAKKEKLRTAGMPVPEVVQFFVEAGDVVLLTTDGVFEKKSAFELKEILSSAESAQAISEKLVSEGSKKEDRAAVVVKIKEPEIVVAPEPQKLKEEKPKWSSAVRETLSQAKNYLPSLSKVKPAAAEAPKTEAKNFERKFFRDVGSIFEGVTSQVKKALAREVKTPESPKPTEPEKTTGGMPEYDSLFKESSPTQPWNEPEPLTLGVDGTVKNQKSEEVANVSELEFKPLFEEPKHEPVPEPDFLNNSWVLKDEEPVNVIVSPQAEEELQKPEAKREIWKKVKWFAKDTDWKGVLYSAGAGAAVRIGAKMALETMSFGTKTAVAAAAGGVTAGVKEYRRQTREANEQLNKFVEELGSREMPDIKSGNAAMFRVSETLVELAGKKQRGEKMTVKDFKEFLKVDTNTVSDLSDSELGIRTEILEEIEKLKTDKKKLAKAALKGAVAGAVGSMVVGEIIEFGSSHNWFGADEKAKDFLTWAKKGLSDFGSPNKSLPSVAVTKEVLGEKIYNPKSGVTKTLKGLGGFGETSKAPSANLPEIPKEVMPDITLDKGLAEQYQEIIKQKLYQFNSERTESLTTASRNLVHDYLANETLLKSAFGKEKLSFGQMVYAEDYIRKALEKMQISPGKQVAVPGHVITEAVEKARQLTAAQLDNLTKIIHSPEHKLGRAAQKFMESQDYSDKSNDTRQLFGVKADGSKIAKLLIVDAP